MYQMGDSKLEVRELLVKAFARQTGCIIAVTGAIDLVSDGERCWCIRNGRPEMSRITGTGCQLSALTTAFLVANPEHKLEAAAAAVCTMGLVGKHAARRRQQHLPQPHHRRDLQHDRRHAGGRSQV